MQPYQFARLSHRCITCGENEAETEATLQTLRESSQDPWLESSGYFERELHLRLLAAVASNPVFESFPVNGCQDEEVARAVAPLVLRKRNLALNTVEWEFLSALMPALAATRSLVHLSLNRMNVNRGQATHLSQTLRRSRIKSLSVSDFSRKMRLSMPSFVRGLRGAPHLTCLVIDYISASTVDLVLQTAHAIPNLEKLNICTKWDNKHQSISSTQALRIEQMIRAPPKKTDFTHHRCPNPQTIRPRPPPRQVGKHGVPFPQLAGHVSTRPNSQRRSQRVAPRIPSALYLVEGTHLGPLPHRH